MDAWLTALKADASRAPIEKKVRRAKPANAFDFCIVGAERLTDPAACEAQQPRFRVSASPRQVAGGQRSEAILKCRLQPLNSADYAPVVFTSAQLARLHAAFPDGVCDWEEKGVGQQRARSPLDFSDGPGGVRLGKAPESRPGASRDDDDDHDDGRGKGGKKDHDDDDD
jgi:hypothetical protein